MADRRELGELGEALAERLLRSKGYRILARNHRTRLGEIDLVCRDRDTIVFVEVKARTSDAFGSPADAVGSTKRSRLRRLAEEYLAGRGEEDRPVRFDVVSVRLDGPAPAVEHIEGAF